MKYMKSGFIKWLAKAAVTGITCMILAVVFASPSFAFLIADGGAAMTSAFDGTNYLVGVENPATSTIGAQLINASGNKVGGLISPATASTGLATNVAFDGANYLLIWEYDPGGSGAGRFQIYGQFISKTGELVRSAFPITSPGIWFEGIKTMAFGGGRYLVTYSRLIDPDHGDNRYIAGRIVSPNGTMGDEFTISGGYGRESDVAFDGANFFVVWCAMNGDGNDSDIRGRFVSPAGVPGTDISVNDSVANSDNPKSVTFDGTNYMVIWNDEIDGLDSGEWNVSGQRISTAGVKVGYSLTINSEAGRQLGTSVAFDGTNYLATWMDMADPSNWNVYGQYIGTSGALVGSKVTIDAGAGNQMGGASFVNGKYLALINNGVAMGNGGITAVEGTYGLFLTPPAVPAAPAISSLSASSGLTGSAVTITGANFMSGATTVIFNGTLSTAVTVIDSGHLTAYVPSGATSGPIKVVTAGGTATGSSFTVTGTGITFSGLVTNSAGAPIAGAKIEMDGSSSAWTLSDLSGHYSLSGLPPGSTFILKFSKNGFLPDYSPYINLTSDGQLPDLASSVLFSPAEAVGWGPSAKGFIAAKIINEDLSGMLNCAVVTATSALHPSTTYPVTYFNGAGFDGSCTYANGIAFVMNVDDGDTVTLQLTSHESSSAPVLPIHANAESGALLFGKVISPRSGNISVSPASRDFGNVMAGGSSDTQIFAISNSGPDDLNVLSGYWIGDTTEFSPSTGTCPTTWPFVLSQGQSCNLAGAFTPKSTGIKSLTFVINSSANNTPAANLPMSGTGVAAYSLTVNVTGGGTVNNHSVDLVGPAFTPCAQPSCTYQYGAGSVFDLAASPAESLTSWSGAGSAVACSGTGHCQFTLISNSTVTAPFTPRAKIHGNSSDYQWLNEAYGAASNNAQIDARNMTFTENFNLANDINVILKGGLADDFTTVNGYTYLQGILTLGLGSLTVDYLVVR